MLEQVDRGNFKNKSVSQVFTKAKSIGKSAKSLESAALGTSKDRTTLQNRVRRGEDAFYAEHGYTPDLDELSEYINDKYNIETTPQQVEEAKFEEFAADTELGGTIGDARDKAQTRIAQEAGLDQLTNEVLGPGSYR